MQKFAFKGKNADFKKYLELIYWLAWLEAHPTFTVVIGS